MRLVKTLEANFKDSTWEVVLVENGSRDNSWQICKELYQSYTKKITIYQLHRSSYGQALRLGIIKARHEILVIYNVDFWDVDFLKQALALIDICDIVVGSKTLIAAQDHRPWYRRQTSYWFNVFLRMIYNFPGTDTHGLKVLKAGPIVPLAKKCYDLDELFDTQLVLRGCRKGLVYTELPVTVREIRPSRYSHLKRIYNVIKDLVAIFRFRYL
jgi:glycosyltransferase involved in cell wall biosynthesis